MDHRSKRLATKNKQTDIEILIISISTLPHFADYDQFLKFIKKFLIIQLETIVLNSETNQ